MLTDLNKTKMFKKFFITSNKKYTIIPIPSTQLNRVVFYDGDCLLCSKTIQFLLKKDKRRTLRYAPQQGETFKHFVIDKEIASESSVIFLKDGAVYTKSSAALGIAKELPYPWKLLYAFIIVPGFIRNLLYDLIARNRKTWFGKTDSCYRGSKEYTGQFLD